MYIVCILKHENIQCQHVAGMNTINNQYNKANWDFGVLSMLLQLVAFSSGNSSAAAAAAAVVRPPWPEPTLSIIAAAAGYLLFVITTPRRRKGCSTLQDPHSLSTVNAIEKTSNVVQFLCWLSQSVTTVTVTKCSTATWDPQGSLLTLIHEPLCC